MMSRAITVIRNAFRGYVPSGRSTPKKYSGSGIAMGILLIAVIGAEHPVHAQGVSTDEIQITAERTTEDGIDLLLVTVSANDQPLENADVRIYIERTFGSITLGQEQTFDDGAAFFPLPDDLPPAQSGRLSIIAEITGPAQYAGARTRVMLDDAPVLGADQPAFPRRALWGSHAPLPLIAMLILLFGGVWTTYAYTLYLVNCIRKGV